MWSSQRQWRRQRWRTLLGLMYGSSDIKLCRQLSHFECKSSACWGRNRWWPIRISNCVVALEGTAIYIIHPILDTWTSELGPGIHAYSFRDHDPTLNRNQGHSFFLPHRTFHSSAFTLNTFQFLTAIELLLLLPHAPCCFYFASVDTLWRSLVLQCPISTICSFAPASGRFFICRSQSKSILSVGGGRIDKICPLK